MIFKKIGILGGGQLGKMLAQSGADFQLYLCAMDKSANVPAAPYVHEFTVGDFNNYEDVMAFGADKDLLTVEIEHVNTRALHELKKMGKKVHPNPEALDIIKDKALQKQFYIDNDFPTSDFGIYDDKQAIWNALSNGHLNLPFVQKSRTMGYDGYGVQIIRETKDLDRVMDTPSVVEQLVAIEKEIAVIAARNEQGQIAVFPAVDMDFHSEANMVEYVKSPASLPERIAETAKKLAERLIEQFDICGLLAVELFLTSNGNLLVNEVAPRPHNSGHITMDNNATSQFEQHLRGILNLPLGSTQTTTPAVMFNLLGHPEHKGPVQYEGLEECLATPNLHLHLYGKKETKPYRKMGHITIADKDIKQAYLAAQKAKNKLIVKSKESWK